MEYVTEEFEELIEGQQYNENENYYELMLYKLKNNKFLLYYIENNFTITREFEDLESAKENFEFYKFKEKENE